MLFFVMILFVALVALTINYSIEGVRLAPDTFIWLVTMAISFFAWSLSLLRLYRTYRPVRHCAELVLPARAYLYPFVHFPIWLITFVVVYLITFSTAYLRTY